MIDLPIHFPTQEEVIAEEVARFRALSPEDRIRLIRDLIGSGAFMMQISPKAAFLHEYSREQEDHEREAIQKFLVRHAG